MDRTELAEMTTQRLCEMIGVRVVPMMNRSGYMVHAVYMEGDAAPVVELRPSRVRGWLIDTVMDFDNAGAFAA